MVNAGKLHRVAAIQYHLTPQPVLIFLNLPMLYHDNHHIHRAQKLQQVAEKIKKLYEKEQI